MNDDRPGARATGRCHCGAVRYEVYGPLRAVIECRCKTCRRLSGGLWHTTAAYRRDVVIHDNGALRWYHTSPPIRRAFCGTCGSTLFAEAEPQPLLFITAGTLDDPTGLTLGARVHIGESPDYLEDLADVPQYLDHGHSLSIPDA